MKLSKINKSSLFLLERNIFQGISSQLDARVDSHQITKDGPLVQYWFHGFRHDRVVSVSKTVYENSTLLAIDSLSDLVELDTKYRDFVILYPFDKMAYIRKVGKEIAFLIVDFSKGKMMHYFGNYNFISGSFHPDDDIEQKKELLRLLIYLFYGDVTERFIEKKSKLKKSSTSYLLNDSSTGIFFASSTWKQRINMVTGFNVRGHFRLQPHGEGSQKRKLIWIEEFGKTGYRKRAVREIYEDIKI